MAVPEVSVVIPSVGRTDLQRAVNSVLGQTIASTTQIVISFDAKEASLALPEGLREGIDVVTWTGGGRRGGFARNRGVELATGELVAFLDDDDEWEPTKLEQQRDVCRQLVAEGGEPLVSTRHVQVDSGSGHRSQPLPLTVFPEGTPVSTYLFRRRRPGGGRASMYTSTLMTTRDVADNVRWDESLPRHQDWDWMIRVASRPAAKVRQLEDALTVIHTGSSGSISAGVNWEDSLVWADKTLVTQPTGVYEDFITAQTLRYAVGARSLEGIRAVLSRLRSRRRLPAVGPMVIAFAGLVPRHTLERLMARIR